MHANTLFSPTSLAKYPVYWAWLVPPVALLSSVAQARLWCLDPPTPYPRHEGSSRGSRKVTLASAGGGSPRGSWSRGSSSVTLYIQAPSPMRLVALVCSLVFCCQDFSTLTSLDLDPHLGISSLNYRSTSPSDIDKPFRHRPPRLGSRLYSYITV